jgi:hypothetical protein
VQALRTPADLRLVSSSSAFMGSLPPSNTMMGSTPLCRSISTLDMQ